MIREQRMMERIINELGEDFDNYIKTFYVCDLWKIKEGELIVNKTFKRVVDIIADFNLTTSNIILDNAYNLIESNEAMMHILGYLCEDFTKNGNDSLLNRSMVFCYCVFIISAHKQISATQVLTEAINSEIVRFEPNLWYYIKYKLRLRAIPYSIKGDYDALLLISLLNGMPIKETFKNVIEYKEMI